MVEKIKRLFWLWIQCIKSMRSLITVVPFLVYAILQSFILYTLVNFIHSPFSGVLIPLIRKLFGEPALHYPVFFHILAPLYSQMNIALSGLLGIVIVGMSTYMFATNYQNHKPDLAQAFRVTLPNYGILFVIWIMESALTLVMIIGVPQAIKSIFQPEYFIGRVIDLVGVFLGIAIASIFAYTTVLIVLAKQKLIRSLSLTYRIFKKNTFTTLSLIAIPTFLYFPINYLTGKSIVLIPKFTPEFIALLLSVGILITFFSSYLQIGSITRFYLLLVERKKR